MKVEFLKKFSKDLDDVKVKSVKRSLVQLIEFIESVESLDSIPNTKKLKGHKAAYSGKSLTQAVDLRYNFNLKYAGLRLS